MNSIQPENKLDILINFVAPSTYKYVSQCTDYDTAIQSLKSVFVKPRNEVYARHVLATRQQQSTENIDEYIQNLKCLTKDCHFKDVTARIYQDEYVREAFINGMKSGAIRQRLLENTTLTLEAAVDQARAMESAQQQSETYCNPGYQINAATEQREAPQHHEEPKRTALPTFASDTEPQLSAAVNKCFFCGRIRHPRSLGPARNVLCNNYDKKGHFAKVCRSSRAKTKQAIVSGLIAAVQEKIPRNLMKAAMPIQVNGKETSALIDTGSTSSFISRVCTHTRL